MRCEPSRDGSTCGVFAAPLRGVEKDQLIGEHVRRQRQEKRRVRTALAVEGCRLHRDPQTVAALFQVVNDNPALVRQHQAVSPFPPAVSCLPARPTGGWFAGIRSPARKPRHGLVIGP